MAARRPDCAIDLVTLAISGRDLVVLLQSGPRDAARLPAVVWRGAGAFDDAARALGASLHAAIAWCAQVGAVAGKSGDRAAVSVVFVALASRAEPLKTGSVWRRVTDLPSRLPAADRDAIAAAVTRVRQGIDHAPIAFRLVPAAFTLSDLQHVYEVLLGRPLHKASFRRALDAARLVQPTDDWRTEGRGRPAQLYRLAPKRRRGAIRTVRFDAM